MADYTFDANWKFQEEFIPQIDDILQQYAYLWASSRLGTFKEDTKQATDWVATTEAASFAVRIRRYGYIRYKDLTIRSYCRGYKTEIDKLKQGHGDFYLYAWTDSDQIIAYWLIDLNKVREADLLNRATSRSNGDGTAFITISEHELKSAGAIIADVDRSN